MASQAGSCSTSSVLLGRPPADESARILLLLTTVEAWAERASNKHDDDDDALPPRFGAALAGGLAGVGEPRERGCTRAAVNVH